MWTAIIVSYIVAGLSILSWSRDQPDDCSACREAPIGATILWVVVMVAAWPILVALALFQTRAR